MWENLENVPIEELQLAEDIVGNIFMFIMVSVLALCFAALVIFYIYEHCKELLSMPNEIEKLKKEKVSSTQAISDYEDVYIITKDNLDSMERMYNKEKDERAKDKRAAELWDSQQRKRIAALEKQLTENGIIPVTKEEVLLAA